MIKIIKHYEVQTYESVYLLAIDANQLQVSIDVQDKYLGHIWNTQIKKQEIQQLTKKCGAQKSYVQFIKMLFSSFQPTNSSVLLNIFTYQNLSYLKNNQNQNSQNSSITKRENQIRQLNQLNNNKRYLILSNLTNFKKIYFPIVLSCQQNPQIQQLKRTINRLSQFIQSANIDYSKVSLKQQIPYQIQQKKLNNSLGKIQQIFHNKQMASQKIEKSIKFDQIIIEKQQLIFNLKSQIEAKNDKIKELLNKVRQLQTKNQLILFKNKQFQLKLQKFQQMQAQYSFLQEKNNNQIKVLEAKNESFKEQIKNLNQKLQKSCQNQKKSVNIIKTLQNQLSAVMKISNSQFKQNKNLKSNINFTQIKKQSLQNLIQHEKRIISNRKQKSFDILKDNKVIKFKQSNKLKDQLKTPSKNKQNFNKINQRSITKNVQYFNYTPSQKFCSFDQKNENRDEQLNKLQRKMNSIHTSNKKKVFFHEKNLTIQKQSDKSIYKAEQRINKLSNLLKEVKKSLK